MELRLPLSPPQIIDGITLKFPAKLWRIVNCCKTGAISWETGGKSIRIQRKQFEHDYLSSSVYFKTTNFPSFIRQLNIYGFRKVPTSNRWQENGTVFEYKHDYFLKGHPELLTEVRRNTAVKRSLQNEFKQNDDALSHSQAKFRDILKKAKQSLPEQDRKDGYNPFLHGPTTIIKYTDSRGAPLHQKQGNITTVYMTPRGAACDMQTISPSRLKDQVVGLLPSINGSDDEELHNRSNLQTGITCGNHSDGTRHRKDFSDKLYSSFSVNKPVKNPILFLPSAGDSGFDLAGMDGLNMDSLSQDSTCININKELMFGCPEGKDDEYDLDQSLTSFDLSDDTDISLSPEPIEFNPVHVESTVSYGDLGSQAHSFNMADTLVQLGDEQGFLTPAYFDPETGTVTLLLPSLTPES